jgi:predicted nucleotidyltransferase
MREPILRKAEPHGYDYKPITWNAFIKLREASQKVADIIGYPVYLVGSALYKEIPRDIDISIIMPLNKFEEMFGELPEKQESYSVYLGWIYRKSFEYVKDLHFCIDYHLDIKVCPDIWWTEKPKMLLAEPQK